MWRMNFMISRLSGESFSFDENDMGKLSVTTDEARYAEELAFFGRTDGDHRSGHGNDDEKTGAG